MSAIDGDSAAAAAAAAAADTDADSDDDDDDDDCDLQNDVSAAVMLRCFVDSSPLSQFYIDF